MDKLINIYMPLAQHKKKALVSLKKTRSLLDKIIKMSEEDKYCVDIIQQNMAAIGLLKHAHHTLFEGHMRSCFKTAFESKNRKRQQQVIDEIMQITKYSPNCLINRVRS